MRLLVNLLLVALTATGPTACCCTASAVSSVVLGRLPPVAGLSAKSSPRFCCPGHNRTTEKPARGYREGRPVVRTSGRSDPPPGQRQCPCQERRSALGAEVAGEVRSSPDLREYEPKTFDPAGSWLTPVTHLGPPERTGASRPRLPFLTTDDRLRAHHVLRC